VVVAIDVTSASASAVFAAALTAVAAAEKLHIGRGYFERLAGIILAVCPFLDPEAAFDINLSSF